MKYISFLLVAVFSLTKAHAQKADDLGKIALHVMIPDTYEDMSDPQAEKLLVKAAQIIASSGMAATQYNTNFGLSAKLLVTETNVVEGGMQNITVVTTDVTLFITQVDNGLVFSSINKQIKGSGSTKELAVNNAISKISVNDPDYKTFIETGKSKIISYYESKCDDLITYADNMAKMHDYENAIGILMSIPIEVKSCYDKAQKNALAVYKEYQDAECAQMIVDAKANIAAEHYIDALNYLTEVDPQSKCSKEANALIKSTGTKVKEVDKKLWDFAMKVYSDDVTLEKHRIDAIKEIAIASYKKKDEADKKDRRKKKDNHKH